ncbi:radical SAM superfamily enzyme YgiQ (UPF0313 family) [Hydrogenispora ethanolica]|uniref:Radical SAM superfamily enzyme YgiQ (UPF0313 family) n=1 Tax=Hydrogenispora ethanolica TaxID=1082276 RepID=A0A4R1R8K6_HYDET|nr:B12-binding domain-containing radical SAM protein [Hydrogenispora ethanolica]TCL61948.1 radical SAM superfamily enzyme YgiQ (UPF0313 family) [Hydrogenispora ethanolica]
MKILLVYPGYPETFWSFKYALRFIDKSATNPPLGLLTVAAMLPPEWEQRLVDLNVKKLADSDLRWADYVLISAMAVQKPSAVKVIERCHALGVKTIAGGPLFTSDPEEFPLVDHLVLNEAELTMPEFLRDLANGAPRRIYTSEQWADLTQTPVPRWDLVDLRRYASTCLQYSRGCPFNCDFCDITALYGRVQRTKTAAQVLAELESLYHKGWRGNVFMVDDNFIGNTQKLKTELLPALTEWMERHRFPFTFYTQLSINLADDEELMRRMVAAGFDTVFIGIETPHEESLAECHKNQNKRRDLVAAVKKIQHFGLQVLGGFIIGFDHDPPTIFEKQIEFIQKSGIVTAMVGLLNAMRGTLLYQRLQQEERLLERDGGNNTDGSLNFIPKMPRELLVNGYRKVVDTIYAPEYYYRRVKEFLKEYRPFPRKALRLSWRDLYALTRAFVSIGIFGEERLYFWKLLGWTMLKRPQSFPLAVTCSIYGFHFRKVFAELKPS